MYQMHDAPATPTFPSVDSYRYTNNLFKEKSLTERTLEQTTQIPSGQPKSLIESYLNDQVNHFHIKYGGFNSIHTLFETTCLRVGLCYNTIDNDAVDVFQSKIHPNTNLHSVTVF
eukprot:Pgem_evm1s547